MNQQKNTTPGEDSIHPQMIKRLPTETQMHLLDIYNKIWEEGKIPKTWKYAIVKPLLQEGKDPLRDVWNYRLQTKDCLYLEKEKEIQEKGAMNDGLHERAD